MSTNFQMLEHLKEYLGSQALFSKVLILKRGLATRELFEQEEDLTSFPACVLTGGDTNTTDGSCTGSAAADVVVISPFYGGSERELSTGHALLQRTLTLLQGEKPSGVLNLGKYFYIHDSVREFPLHDEFLAWDIRLNVKFSFE